MATSELTATTETLAEKKARYLALREAVGQGFSELKELEHELINEIQQQQGGELTTDIIESQRFVRKLNGKRLWEILRKRN